MEVSPNGLWIRCAKSGGNWHKLRGREKKKPSRGGLGNSEAMRSALDGCRACETTRQGGICEIANTFGLALPAQAAFQR